MNESSNQSTHILVVDDDPVIQALTSDCLTALGYRISAASSGEEALRALAAEIKPQLVLLDMFMPGLDGIQVLKRIRADTSLRELKVIFLSAENDAESVLRQNQLTAEGVLRKPYQLKELAQSLQKILSAR
jgi:CheY-like chemotaxis protein